MNPKLTRGTRGGLGLGNDNGNGGHGFNASASKSKSKSSENSDADVYAARLRQLALLEAEEVERPPTSKPDQGASFCVEDTAAVEAVVNGLGCLTVSDPSQEHSPMVYVSPGFEKLTGYSREELLGRSIGCLHARDADEVGVKRLQDAMEGRGGEHGGGGGVGGAAVRVELLSKKKNGENMWLATTAVPVRDATGKLLRVVAVSYDITARKASAAAVEGDASDHHHHQAIDGGGGEEELEGGALT